MLNSLKNVEICSGKLPIIAIRKPVYSEGTHGSKAKDLDRVMKGQSNAQPASQGKKKIEKLVNIHLKGFLRK